MPSLFPNSNRYCTGLKGFFNNSSLLTTCPSSLGDLSPLNSGVGSFDFQGTECQIFQTTVLAQRAFSPGLGTCPCLAPSLANIPDAYDASHSILIAQKQDHHGVKALSWS